MTGIVRDAMGYGKGGGELRVNAPCQELIYGEFIVGKMSKRKFKFIHGKSHNFYRSDNTHKLAIFKWHVKLKNNDKFIT